MQNTSFIPTATESKSVSAGKYNLASAAWLAIAAIITYQALLVVLILLRPDLDPYWHTISEWAIGPYGLVMSIAFMISSLSYASLFIAVRSQVRGFIGSIGLGLLLICVIGAFGVGLFTTDPFDVKELSTTGILHIIFGTSQLMLLPFAALFISMSLAFKNDSWRSARQTLVIAGLLPLLAFLGSTLHLMLFVMPLGENAYGPDVPLGYPARLVFLVYALWVITISRQVIEFYREEKT